MIYGNVYFLEDGCTFELAGRDLIVAGAQRDAQLIGFLLEVLHEGKDTFRNGTEIMILELLSLRGRMADECTATHHDIRTGIGQGFIYDEVFLLPAEGGGDLGYILIKIVANLYSSFIKSGNGFQER